MRSSTRTHYCAFGSDRSYTDPVTNLTVVSGINASAHLWLISRGALGSDSFSAFVHEATHSYTCASLVGGALAMLHQRAVLYGNAAQQRRESESAAQRHFLRDYSRFQQIAIALRPIAEGIALLMELDAVPPAVGHSMYSAPMWWLSNLFAGDLPHGVVEQVVETQLWNARSSEEALEKRADLLAAPSTCSDGGYLLGYMVMHSLLSHVRETHGDLVTVDEFAKIARYVVFSDPDLEQLILSDDDVCPSAGRTISEHVAARLDSYFRSPMLPHAVARMRALRPDPNDTPEQFLRWTGGSADARALAAETGLGLFGSPEAYAAGVARHDKVMRELLEPGQLCDVAASLTIDLYVQNHYVMTRRELFWLCSDSIEVRVGAREVRGVLPNGDYLLAHSGEHQFPLGSSQGTIDVILSIAGQYRVDVVQFDGNVLTASSNIPDALKPHLQHLVIGRSALEGKVKATIARCAGWYEEFAGVGSLAELQDSARSSTSQSYGRIAYSGVTGAGSLQIADRTTADGWYGILADENLVRGMARLMLLSAHSGRSPRVTHLFDDIEINADACASAIRDRVREVFGDYGALVGHGAGSVVTRHGG
jgi:hypothetical protein